jgi:hypothetical protein
MVGPNLVRSTVDTSALRCFPQSQGFRIVGFAGINTPTSISVYFKLTATASSASSAISADIFGIYNNNITRISLAQISTITITASTTPVYLFRYETVTVPLFASITASNYQLIEGTFNLRLTALINGDFIYITEPSWTVYGTRRMVIKPNISTVTGWT